MIAQRPRLTTLRRMHRAGFEIPQFAPSVQSLHNRQLGCPRPWGSTSHPNLYSKLWALTQRHAFTEQAASDLLLPKQGLSCSSIAEARAFIDRPFIAKAPLSASGQHRIRLDRPGAHAWLERHLSHGHILIEPWHDRILDLSVQIEIHDEGPKLLGITRFFTRPSGSYCGALIGPWTRGLTPEIARVVHGGSGKGTVQELLEHAGQFVGSKAHALGYRGPLGIDAMLVHTEHGPKLQPILEVNPRTTMGRIALAISKRSSSLGGWFFVTDKERAAAGYTNRAQLIAAIESTKGVLFTSEPESASGVQTILSLAATWQQAMSAWTDLGFTSPILVQSPPA